MFGLSKSDVAKMETKRNLKGLSKALSYKKDSEVRRDTAEALGRIGDARAVPWLCAAMDDPELSVCCASVNALGRIGNSEAWANSEPRMPRLRRRFS